MQNYPNQSGYKDDGTSRAAAEYMDETGRAKTLRNRVLDHVRKCGYNGCTTDVCAAALGESVLAIRPRFTELEHYGLIRKTKLTEKNESGRAAAVYMWAGLYTGGGNAS